MKKVIDMYKVTSTARKPLLSDYGADFWTEYVNNYEEFDNLFKTLYKNFRFFEQECDETVEEVTDNFIDVVKAWLMANTKRYSELWRVQVVDDNKYSILDNYNITEEYTGLNTTQSIGKEGARTDVDDLKVGNQNAENQTRISAFNSNDMASKNTIKNANGTRNDVETFTKGEMENTYASNEGMEHNMHKYGNIGIRTMTEVLEKHTNYWRLFNFYKIVFSDIQEQFLLV